MRKIVYGLMIFLVAVILTGCGSKEIKVYSEENLEEFNEILTNIGDGKTKAYDLRVYEECYSGRIPGFYCSRVEDIQDETEALDRVIYNLTLLLGDKKRTLIILIDNDGENSDYVSKKLFDQGYSNVHYFKDGYERYVELQDGFIPETGECDC